MENLAQSLVELIKTHESWAIAVLLGIAFTESSAFISLVFPGVTLLITAGTLMQSGALPYLPGTVGAILGAVIGSALSYLIGRRLGDGVSRIWPFTRNLDLLPAGIRFFQQHGGKSVFIGRFYGPIRATIPLAAGVLLMPSGWFWAANIASALLWVPMLLLVGDAVGEAGEQLIGSPNTVVLVFVGLTLFALAGLVWGVHRAARSKR